MIQPTGEAKYDLSSFDAMATMLRMGSLFSGGHLFVGGGRQFVRRERQEDFLEAHAHRAELQKSQPAADHGAREIAADVVAGFAVDLVADQPLAALCFGH